MNSKSITLVEVGPRDGLQSEPEILPTASKASRAISTRPGWLRLPSPGRWT